MRTGATQLDDIDQKIIGLLQEDGRMTHAAIAAAVGLTPPSVFERVRKLEHRGVIEGYMAKINPEALGKNLTAFIRITVSDDAFYEPGVQALADDPDILEAYHVAGEDCFLIKTKVGTTADLEAVLQRVRSRFTVQRSVTMIALRAVKENSPLSIEGPAPTVSLVS